LELFGSYLTFWFVLGFILLIIEFLTPGVVALFFGLGAWVVLLILAFAPIPVWAQWLVFSVSSIVFLVLLRKHVIRWFATFKSSKKDSLSEPMVARRYLGQEVDVLEDILPGRPGPVELNGTRWMAKTDVGLSKGDRARIVALEELTFRIEPISSPPTSLEKTEQSPQNP
jgi:membrane protein implicated in regulation of membrane protease activity